MVIQCVCIINTKINLSIQGCVTPRGVVGTPGFITATTSTPGTNLLSFLCYREKFVSLDDGPIVTSSCDNLIRII